MRAAVQEGHCSLALYGVLCRRERCQRHLPGADAGPHSRFLCARGAGAVQDTGRRGDNADYLDKLVDKGNFLPYFIYFLP